MGYVVLQHGAMGSMAPGYVYGRDVGAGHPWLVAVLHGLFVLAASAALVANWRAHAQVRLSERRHRRQAERYMEVAGVMHLLIDRHGVVQMANRMTCDTLQLPERELIGADWFALAVPEEERAARRAGFDAMVASGADRVERENRVVCADGSIRLMQWVFTFIRDDAGAVEGVLSTATDVTERRAVEARLERERRDLAGLRRLAQDVASLDDARQAVVDRVVELTDARVGALLEPSARDTALCFTVATMESLVGDVVRVGREPSAAATAFTEARPVFVDDADNHEAISRRRFAAAGVAAVLCQPIMSDGRPIGVLAIGWTDPVEELEPRAAELVELAADEAAHALTRLAAMRRLTSAALTDGLTGVPNRRAFDAELPRALALAGRSGRDVALAYMDLNGFKALNDRDGHEAGDRLLKATAAAWQAELRETDLLARVGGDEFAVILPDCPAGAAERVTERLRAAVPHAPAAASASPCGTASRAPRRWCAGPTRRCTPTSRAARAPACPTPCAWRRSMRRGSSRRPPCRSSTSSPASSPGCSTCPRRPCRSSTTTARSSPGCAASRAAPPTSAARRSRRASASTRWPRAAR